MTARFTFIAWPDDQRVVAASFNHAADDMLAACGFNWNRRLQRWVGQRSRLAGMNRLIDAGFIPAWGDVWREGMGEYETLPYGQAVRLLAREQPTRCPRTLEMFA